MTVDGVVRSIAKRHGVAVILVGEEYDFTAPSTAAMAAFKEELSDALKESGRGLEKVEGSQQFEIKKHLVQVSNIARKHGVRLQRSTSDTYTVVAPSDEAEANFFEEVRTVLGESAISTKDI